MLKVQPVATETDPLSGNVPRCKVIVSLSELDYRRAKIAASEGNETVSEWISTLVSAALRH